MAIIGINYDGGNIYDDNYQNIISNDMVYKSVTLSLNNDKFIYDSGNFVKDWFEAKKKFIDEMDNELHLSTNSTVNHFQSDGGNFDSGYLHVVDGKPVLKYLDTNELNYFITQKEIYENGWEYFVPNGTQPTWEELKEICK